MDKEKFAEFLDTIKDITLLQIVKVIPRLKYKTLAMIFLFFAGILGGAFAAGRYSHQKETAVMLESPFAMRIVINEDQHDFTSLTLTKDPSLLPPAEDRVVLSLREIKSAFDIIPVGKVVAQIEENRLSGFWSIFISKHDHGLVNEAHAANVKQAGFDWKGHENDMKFKERFVDDITVHRHYSDGCILEYKVDRNKRRSIPSSFRWIKVTH